MQIAITSEKFTFRGLCFRDETYEGGFKLVRLDPEDNGVTDTDVREAYQAYGNTPKGQYQTREHAALRAYQFLTAVEQQHYKNGS